MDERAGMPSASILERIQLCLGSWRMGRGLPGVTTPDMLSWAASGDRIHLWLHNPSLVDLTAWPDELEVAQECARQRDELVGQVFAEMRRVFRAAPLHEFKEERLWYQMGKRRVFSGKTDYAAVMNTTGLVVDYKTNRGDVTESARNMQLRSLAVMLWASKTLRKADVYVAIIQPLAGKPELCRYTRDDLFQAERELRAILKAAFKADAPLTAGEKQCKFCPAKLKCPAAIGMLKDVAWTEVGQLSGITAQALSELLVKCQVAKQVITAAETQAKLMLKENAASVPTWRLRENAPIREIADTKGAYEALCNAGYITAESFLKCVTVGVGALEKAVTAHTGMKRREAKDTINSHIEHYIALKPKEASLERTE